MFGRRERVGKWGKVRDLGGAMGCYETAECRDVRQWIRRGDEYEPFSWAGFLVFLFENGLVGLGRGS